MKCSRSVNIINDIFLINNQYMIFTDLVASRTCNLSETMGKLSLAEEGVPPQPGQDGEYLMMGVPPGQAWGTPPARDGVPPHPGIGYAWADYAAGGTSLSCTLLNSLWKLHNRKKIFISILKFCHIFFI